MREWLTVELLLGTLLVTTFTCVGVLALWAATSPRHWFLRAAVTFGVLSPLLLVPAYGPFLAFALLIVTIAICIDSYRRWQQRRDTNGASSLHNEPPQKPRWQFSIKSAFALCTCVALTTAIIVRIPQETWQDWPIFTLAAGLSAAITLLAAWTIHGRTAKFVRNAVACMFPINSAGFATLYDIPSQVPLKLLKNELNLYFSIAENQLRLLLLTAAAFFATLALTLLLASFRHPNTATSEFHRKRKRWITSGFALWSLLIVTPPALTLSALLQPLPAVDDTLPTPNGFDELVRLGQRLDTSAIKKELAADVVDEAKLDAAVPQYESDFAAIRTALTVPLKIPIEYNYESFDVDSPMALRNVARMLDAKADSKSRTKDMNEALSCRLQILSLAQSIEHSGLLVHFMLGSAIEGTATAGIYRDLPAMNAAQCREALRALAEFNRNRVSFDDVRQRELVWMVKAQGWPNHISYLFDQILGEDNFHSEGFLDFRNQAIDGLLMTELSLRVYRLDHGQLPNQLTDLVPEYLATQPADPFAPAPQPFHYILTGNSYKLWSVGNDGIDDDGAPLSKNEYGWSDLTSRGDLQLADFYAPDDPPKTDANNK